eukprot:scaffold13622_cov131-Skeletonema_marinoi.AAC.2
MIIIKALPAAAATALIALIILFSASSASASVSAYSHQSYYCNKSMCCWALNVNHWDVRNICYGCEGQDVCNYYTPRTRRPIDHLLLDTGRFVPWIKTLLDTGHFVPWIKTNFCGIGTRITSFDEASVDRGFISRRGVC